MTRRPNLYSFWRNVAHQLWDPLTDVRREIQVVADENFSVPELLQDPDTAQLLKDLGIKTKRDLWDYGLIETGGYGRFTDTQFLVWIHQRLVRIHHENINYDYMHRLRRVIGWVRNIQYAARQDGKRSPFMEMADILEAVGRKELIGEVEQSIRRDEASKDSGQYGDH